MYFDNVKGTAKGRNVNLSAGILGFGGNFIYAQTLDEDNLWLQVIADFMPVERIGTFWNINPAAKTFTAVTRRET